VDTPLHAITVIPPEFWLASGVAVKDAHHAISFAPLTTAEQLTRPLGTDVAHVRYLQFALKDANHAATLPELSVEHSDGSVETAFERSCRLAQHLDPGDAVEVHAAFASPVSAVICCCIVDEHARWILVCSVPASNGAVDVAFAVEMDAMAMTTKKHNTVQNTAVLIVLCMSTADVFEEGALCGVAWRGVARCRQRLSAAVFRRIIWSATCAAWTRAPRVCSSVSNGARRLRAHGAWRVPCTS
jgi:hypothetical protein